MTEKHTVHMADGRKVVIEGDRVELHLTGPLVFDRRHWVKYLTPSEEARRTVNGISIEHDIADALAKAFTDVPMTVYREADE